MIEFILGLLRAEDESVVRTLVGDRANITIIGPDAPYLAERADVDTLLMEDWPAVEWYLGRPPRALGWVVVDAVRPMRVLLYETTITAFDHEYAPNQAAASWIAALAHYAPATLADGGDPAAVRDAEEGKESLPDGEAYFPIFLNAFERMERHNASGTVPPIRHVGIQAMVGWMTGLLRAYDTYHARALSGEYGL